MVSLDWALSVLKPFGTRIVVSIIIIILGLVVGRIIGRLVKKLLQEIELDRLVKLATGINLALTHTLSAFATYFIYFIFVIWALEYLGLGSIVLNILAGGVVVLVILSLLLSLKDFIPNAMAGLFLHLKGLLKEGETIRFENVEGKVVAVNLVETRIETKDKEMIYLPNSVLVKNRFTKKKVKG